MAVDLASSHVMQSFQGGEQQIRAAIKACVEEYDRQVHDGMWQPSDLLRASIVSNSLQRNAHDITTAQAAASPWIICSLILNGGPGEDSSSGWSGRGPVPDESAKKKRAKASTDRSKKKSKKPVHWVECDRCGKWRTVLAPHEEGKEWFCEMNDDSTYNSCDIDEEKYV